jgi:hypothetical protein
VNTLRLYNPYHDKRGRFASKPGGAATEAPKRRSKTKVIVATAAAIAAAGTIAYIAKKQGVDISPKQVIGDIRAANRSVYYGPEEFKQKRNALGAAKNAIVNHSEYITRKNGIGPKLARAGLDISTDLALSYGLNMYLMPAAMSLTSAGLSAASLAVFGAVAPPALLSVGGLVVGAGATVIAFKMIDKYKTRGFHAYLNRTSPKDNEHLYFSGEKGKSAKVARVFDAIALGQAVAIQTVMTGMGVGPGLGGVGLEATNDETKQFSRMIHPFACNVAMDVKQSLTIPHKVDALKDFPGFIVTDRFTFMDKDGAIRYLHAWENKELPELQPVSWGYMKIKNGE